MELLTRTCTIIMCIIVMLILPQHTRGLNVLLVPTMPPSHIRELVAIGQGLVTRGHQASLVVGDTFPKMDSLREAGLHVLTFKYRPLGQELTFYTEEFGEYLSDMVFVRGDKYGEKVIQTGSQLVLRDCELTLTDDDLVDRIRDSNFDIAVVDGFPFGYCQFLLPYTLGIPFTYAYGGTVTPLSFRAPGLPSFTPFQLTYFSEEMTFTQRLTNFAISLLFEILDTPLEGRWNTSLLQRYAPEVKDWGELMRKSLVFFVLKDHHLDFPAASMPNVVYTQGVTMGLTRPLAEEFQSIVDDAPDGIVVVTFGSLVPGFPPRMLRRFLGAFSRHPNLLFIWRLIDKYVADLEEESIPSNVIIRRWIPQVDLLAHAKMRLFITHGGNNGQWEAVSRGVPMVCMPVFAEQFHNCFRTQLKGFSFTVDMYDFSEDELYNAIWTVTNDRSYSVATRRMANLLKTRPDAAGVVVDWLEHVVEFGGSHLRSSAMDMPLYQFLMIDVIVTLVFIVISMSTLMITVCYCICSKCIAKRRNHIKNVKND